MRSAEGSFFPHPSNGTLQVTISSHLTKGYSKHKQKQLGSAALRAPGQRCYLGCSKKGRKVYGLRGHFGTQGLVYCATFFSIYFF